jgi:hypothetical protein
MSEILYFIWYVHKKVMLAVMLFLFPNFSLIQISGLFLNIHITSLFSIISPTHSTKDC